MATLSSIRKQIAALEKKAQDLVKKESAQAIAKAREIIARYGLTAEDLGLAGGGSKKTRKSPSAGKSGKAKQKKAPGAPMYRDPESGKTWTGRGKPPTWIAGLADRTPFLIARQDESAAVVKPARAGRRGSTRSESPATQQEGKKTKKRAASKPSKKAASSRQTAARRPAKKTSSRKAAATKATEPASAAAAAGESSAT
jgi:DNA-binding protein H-NS